MSIAGKREGLCGTRSNLFYEAIRIIKKMECKKNGKYPIHCVGKVPDIVRQTKVRTLGQSSKKSAKSKMKDYLFLKVENGLTQGKSWECILPFVEVLDAQYWGVPRRKRIYLVADFAGNLPTKYYLSQKAFSEMFRRASARGKQLPQMLRIALEQQALTDTMQN